MISFCVIFGSNVISWPLFLFGLATHLEEKGQKEVLQETHLYII